MNREGQIQIGIGLADIGFGIALAGAPGGGPPGLLLIAVGADQVYTGIANILTGQKSRSLVEEAGYNLTLKLGFSESTAGVVGQLTPGLVALDARICGH